MQAADYSETDPATFGRNPSFSITGGNTDGAFAVRPQSNTNRSLIELYISSANLDWESTPKYSLDVRVIDGGVIGDNNPLAYTGEVVVNVIDVNDLTISSFSVGASNKATVGGDRVTIIGTNMGPIVGLPVENIQLLATLGPITGTEFTATECNVTKSNTEVTCTAPEFNKDVSSKNLKWILTVVSVNGVQKNHSATSTATTSYSAPIISHVESADAFGTQGGQAFVVHGAHFGGDAVSVYVSYGPTVEPLAYAASECKIKIPHVAVQCLSVEGWGKNLSFSISLGSQSSDVTYPWYAYAPPQITSISGPLLLNTSGGQLLTVTGQNFGRQRSTTAPILGAGTALGGLVQPGSGAFPQLGLNDVALYYGRNHGYEIRALDCSVTRHHIEMVCTTAPGVGVNHLFRAAAGKQISPKSASSTQRSYKAPMIYSIRGPGASGP